MPTKTPAQRRTTKAEIVARAFTLLEQAWGQGRVRANIKLPRKRGQKGLRPDITLLGEAGDIMAIVNVCHRGPTAKVLRHYEQCPHLMVIIRNMLEADNVLDSIRKLGAIVNR